MSHTDNSNSSSPVPEKRSFVVCPRRGKIWGSTKTSTAPVELSLELLKPYFRKPLNQACLELGLSASAIKKACRAFGIPKWPCRALTAKHSAHRAEMEEVSEGRCSPSSNPSSPVEPKQEVEVQPSVAISDVGLPFHADFSWSQNNSGHSESACTSSESEGEEDAAWHTCSSPFDEPYMESIPAMEEPPTPSAAHVVFPDGMPGVDPSPRAFDGQKLVDDSWLGSMIRPSKKQILSFIMEVPEFPAEPVNPFDDGLFSLNTSPRNALLLNSM